MIVKVILLFFSTVVTALFFLYGFNCYYLLSARRRYRCPAPAPLSGRKPRVAIHLPVYNERYVVGRLLRACASLVQRYGVEASQIVVIDDSNDDTVQEVDRLAADLRERGVAIHVLRRPDRAGFKAGALQLALQGCRDEYIAVFDADFVPPASFLCETLPFLAGDEGLAVVQCRWEHMNAGYNAVTRAVALGIDAHFLVEQPGRHAADCFLNFNGSAGVIRTAALHAAGGWQADTLCEDLDASYRIQLAGYRVLYLRDMTTPAEVPPTVPTFRRQQARWACGSLQAARKLLPRLLTDRRVCARRRLQGFIHLTGYLVHPLMFLSFLLCAAGAFVDTRLPWSVPWAAAAAVLWCAIGACALAIWTYPLAALRARGQPVRKNLASLVVLCMLGSGICLSNTVETLKGLFGRRALPFRRTPKYGVSARGDDWRTRIYQVPLDPLNLLEAGLGVFGLAAAVIAAVRASYPLVPFLLFYSAGFCFVVVMTLMQGRQGAGR